MRLGVIADVHGNDVALRAMLDDAEQRCAPAAWLRRLDAPAVREHLPGLQH